MSEYKDEASKTHHVRITVPDLELATQKLKLSPGLKAIVRHSTGRGDQTRPHLHVFFELEEAITKVGLKKRLQKVDEFFAGLKGQATWTFRPHDSYEAWCQYVCRNVSHVVIEGDDSLRTISSQNQLPVLTIGEATQSLAPRVVITKKRSMRDKFIDYLRTERNWVIGRNPGVLETSREAIDFWQFGFTNPEMIRMVRHAIYVFSDADARDAMATDFAEKIAGQIV